MIDLSVIWMEFMVNKKILLLLFAPLLLTACGEPEDNRPGQPVKHRRQAFANILHAFEPMGVQLRKGRYNADEFLVWAKALDQAKDAPWPYFGAETNYPPTHARATVWSDPERFAANRRDFLKAAEHLLVAAESRDEQRVKQAYDEVHDTCRTCHKAFKD